MRYFLLFAFFVAAAFPANQANSGLMSKAIGAGGAGVFLCLRAAPCRDWITKALIARGVSSIEKCMADAACSAYVVSMAKQFVGGATAPAQSEKRTLQVPQKPKKGCTAICRADANDNIPGNLKDGVPLFSFGEATASNCQMAVKEAKRRATHALGMQPKHIGCETAGK